MIKREIPQFEYIPSARDLQEIIKKIQKGEMDIEREVSEIVRLRYGTEKYKKTITFFAELNELSNAFNIPVELPEIVMLVASTDSATTSIEDLHLKHLQTGQAKKLFQQALNEKKKYATN